MLAMAIGLTAVVMYYVLGYNEEHKFTFVSCLMFGSIISATDPVAVVALLKELGASKRLSTIIEGESLFNDGTAFVLFLLFQGMVLGEEATPGKAIGDFFRLSFGGVALGIAAGVVI
jgi:NhaP-type Na+/H+ or K+/H+ antiporter